MSNATETKTAKVLEPQPSACEATPPGHTEQPAEHTERKDSKKPRHTAEGTQASHLPTATTRPPCPDWCGEKPGHDYDTDVPATGEMERYHSWDAPAIGEQHHAWASISGCEVWLDGVVTLKAPYIYASADEELTAWQARAYSAELLLAANKLDEINGAK